MNEKRTDFVTIMCWAALGIGGLIVLIFIISMVYQTFTGVEDNNVIIQKTEKKEQVEIDDNQNQNEKEYNATGNTETKIATLESHSNYMNGYNDGTFLPNGGISRAEVAAIFARLDNRFDESRVYYKGKYSDVPQESWFANYVGYCDINLIMQGYSDGTFNPQAKMKKGEFLAAIVRYAEVNYTGYTSKYDDVKGTWAESYIGYLESKGFVSGKTATTFGLQDNITRAEVCNVVNNVLGRQPNKAKVDATTQKKYFTDVPASSWFYYDVIEATTFHDIDLYHVVENKTNK